MTGRRTLAASPKRAHHSGLGMAVRPLGTVAAGVALAVLGGVGSAAQARINGELAVRLGDGVAAAVISFGTGLVLLTLALPWLRSGLAQVKAAVRNGELKAWQCLGGACGAGYVASQGLTVGSLGVAAFVVAVVAGQSASSLAVDHAGLGPSGPMPISRTRMISAGLAVIAVTVAMADRLHDAHTLALAALPLLAGLGIAWQQAMNGLVREASGSAPVTAYVNFAVGTGALLAVYAAVLAVRGAPSGALPSEPWLYLGGPLGIAFIAIAAAVVKRIGVLLLGLGMIAGQVCGALVVDALYPSAAGRPGTQTVAGALLALVAVAIALRR